MKNTSAYASQPQHSSCIHSILSSRLTAFLLLRLRLRRRGFFLFRRFFSSICSSAWHNIFFFHCATRRCSFLLVAWEKKKRQARESISINHQASRKRRRRKCVSRYMVSSMWFFFSSSSTKEKEKRKERRRRRRRKSSHWRRHWRLVNTIYSKRKTEVTAERFQIISSVASRCEKNQIIYPSEENSSDDESNKKKLNEIWWELKPKCVESDWRQRQRMRRRKTSIDEKRENVLIKIYQKDKSQWSIWHIFTASK